MIRTATRAALLAALGLALAGCDRSAVTTPTDHALAGATAWLWQEQRDDGSWRSPQYAVLRSGDAYTAFILHALLDVPEEVAPRPPGAVARALEFLRERGDEDGVLGYRDPELLEYPIYATAYAMRCFARAGRADDRPRVERMARWLSSRQFREDSGFSPAHPAYGGFGFGEIGLRPGETGHMELSHTRRVLASLRAVDHEDPACYRRAEAFLALLQRQPSHRDRQPTPPGCARDDSAIPFDGGFYFSPVIHDANKGGVVPPTPGDAAHYRSYATATCDGILALLACGVPADDDRVRAAMSWLATNSRLELPSGIPPDQPEAWDRALFHYHLAVRAEAIAALRLPDDAATRARARIGDLLVERQAADGSFRNEESSLQKEDDPLLATTHAVIALTHAR